MNCVFIIMWPSEKEMVQMKPERDHCQQLFVNIHRGEAVMYQIELIFSSYCKQQISTQKNFAFIWGIDFIGAFSIQGQYVRK